MIKFTGFRYENIGKLFWIQYFISMIIIPEKNDNINEKLDKKEILLSSFLNLRTFPVKLPNAIPVKQPIAINKII